MWISGALFEQKRFFFDDNLTRVGVWTRGDTFYKNLLMRSVLKSQFQNPRNLDEKNWISSRFTQKQPQIHDRTKNGLNTL